MDIDNRNENLFSPRLVATENMEIPQRQFSWFKENGLINKLRAQIREQMIIALKDNIMNSTKTDITSPKVQAINLLVADFLMNQENLFTLSVFITEVPLLGNVQEFSSYVNCLGSSNQNLPVTKPRFQFEDTKDILGALGVQPNTNISQLTCQYYYNDNKMHSLLACLFKALTTIKSNLSKNDEVQSNKHLSNEYTNIEWDNYEHRLNNWLVSVEDILSSFNLNEGQRNSLKKLLKKYHQNNNAQVNAVYKERLKHLEKQNKSMVEKVMEIEQLLATHFHSQNSNLFQKEQIEQVTKNLRLEQKQLYHVIHIFEEKERSLQEKMYKSQEEFRTKFQDIEKQNHELHLKNIEVLRCKKIVEEESLKLENKTRIESNKVELLQQQNEELAKQLQEIKSKVDVIEGYKQVQLTSSDQIDNNLQRIESSLDRETIRKLQRENGELREFIKVQRQRIEELSNRTLNLAKQMERNYQIPQINLNHQTNTNVKKKLNFGNDLSKKHCYSGQNISSTTTDHSTTVLESDNQTEEDILQEAHSRMQMLEMKTAKVEENLKNIQTNRMSHNTDYKIIKVDKKSYNRIRSHVSDDSDFSTFKSNSHKINLKELANKIGYHRSIRRSTNNSLSENETSSEILQNIKYYKKNYTNLSPIKVPSFKANDVNNESPTNRQSLKINSPIDRINDIELSASRPMNKSTHTPIESQSLPTILSSNINVNSMNKESPEHRRNSITNSPLDRINDTEISLNTFMNTSTQLPKDSQSPTNINRLFPEIKPSELDNSLNQSLSKTINLNGIIKTGGNTTPPKDNSENNIVLNNYNNILQLSHQRKTYDTSQNQNQGLNGVDSSSSSKTEHKSDHIVSFGSNNTEKSSDFWT